MRIKLSKIDAIFSILLFVTITQFYRVIAVILKADSLLFSTAIISIGCLAYIAFHGFKLYLGKTRLLWFGSFIIGMPMISLLYAPTFAAKEILLQIHYLLLFLASIIFFHTPRDIKLLLTVAFIFIWASLLLSMVYPELFSSMATAAAARSYYYGRGYGIFLQPNLFSYNMTLIMIMILFSFNASSLKNVFIIFYIIGLILTGSRGGMITGFFLLLGIYIFSKNFNPVRFTKYLLTFFVILFLSYFLFYFLSKAFDINIEFLSGRVLSLSAEETIEDDGSVQDRLENQSFYIQRILENPSFGYGIGSEDYLQGSSLLIGAAHNQFLQLALQYGLIGFGLLMICGNFIWKDLKSNLFIYEFKANVVIIIVLMIICFGTNMLFNMQNFYILLGFIYGRLIKNRFSINPPLTKRLNPVSNT